MANWTGTARSNYFKVKDEDAFEAWVENLGMELIADKERRFGFIGNDSDSGGFPTGRWDDETGELTDTDIGKDIVQFLVEGEVCILMEVGAEGARYVTGYAVAIHSDGRTLRVNIDNIYAKVEDVFRVKPTAAAY